MSTYDDQATCLHESGHACLGQQFGYDVRLVALHRDGGGVCEIRAWLEELDEDPHRALVYLLAGTAAEGRAGRKSPRDAQDRDAAAALASVIHDHKPVSDPAVQATLRAAEAVADALMNNPVVWDSVQRVAKALRRRKRLSGYDVRILREGRR